MTKTSILFASLFMLLSISFAQEGNYTPMADIPAFEERLNKAASTIKTIQSDFTQEKQLSFMTEGILSNGQFFFRDDVKVRWEYTSPFQYVIVINKDKLYIKDEEKLNSIDLGSNEMFQEINDMVVGSIQGQIINNEKFSPEYFENTVNYLVKMTPTDPQMKEFIKQIIIEFSKKDVGVKSVKIVELSDDFTKINFTKTQYNTQIPDETFNPN